MMLPATVPHRLLPALRLPRTRLRSFAEHMGAGVLEFAAFAGFLAMCIGLMAELS